MRKSREQRREMFFYGEKGKLRGAVVNKEFIGGNWEFEVRWLFIG